jgi:hypothetical protein
MKISKTKLHQIIKEEVTSLMEAPSKPLTKTVDMVQQKRRSKRAKEKANLEDFFGSTGDLGDPDTKTFDPPEVPRKTVRVPKAPTGYEQRAQAAAAERGDTVAMSRGALHKRVPPDQRGEKTIPTPPQKKAQQIQHDAEEAGAKQATHRDLNDPERISITDFDDPVMKEVINTYEQKVGTTVGEFLGSGEFGIVYRGQNDEYGDVAVKFTLSGQEINAYKNIKRLKDGLESRDPEIGNVLPTIINITTIISDPVAPEGAVRRGKLELAFDGQKYKVFVIEMELLKKLDPEIRSDIFSPAPMDEYPPEVRERFVDEYLSIENVYSSLEHLIGGLRWEKVLDAIQPEPISEGPTGRSIEIPKSAQKSSLPIKDARAFPPFREIEKFLPRLRQAYMAANPENHFFALRDIHQLLATEIRNIFGKYIEDENLLGQIESSAGYMLPAQMAANARLPQYDPEAIKKSPGLRSSIMPPSELQTRVAKNFYKRLKKLEKYDAQYGDVHASNLMMRDNGDLVVADVGLFMFGPQGDKGYAGTIAERFQHLAGIILK